MRCAPTRACSTSRICASSTSRQRRARVPALRPANNIDKLKTPGKALYSCLLRDDGGVLDDLIVYYLADDFFRLVVNAATADKDIAWLSRCAIAASGRPGLVLTPRTDLAMIAVQGPNAREDLWRALPESAVPAAALPAVQRRVRAECSGEVFVARTGYTARTASRSSSRPHTQTLWNTLAAAGVAPCGLGARDTLRLEAGMNLYGQDMDETTSPLESGLAWTVDLASPRDFVGKAALAASPPARQLVGLLLTDAGGVLRAHQKVRTEAGDGEITSGTFSPTLGKSIALARLPATIAQGSSVQVDIRDKRLAARVVKPPFVRNGKVLVS
jgi:aminomethyltransferase